MNKYKKKIFNIIEIGSGGDRLSRAFDLFIVLTIMLNLFVTLADTFDELDPYDGIFGVIDLPTFSLFGITKFHRFFPGVVALGMNSGAYLCEIIRSGIQSIDGGPTEAARSLGLNQSQALRFVVLPQAIRNILPAIANEFVVIIKESAVTYTIGVQDIMAVVQSVKGATYLIMEPLLVATALYFCLCFPTSKLIAYIERRMSRGDKR